MKYLITGSGGMLGSWVKNIAPGYVCAYPHDKLNITDRYSFIGALIKDNPDVVINCAGIVKGRKDVPTDHYYKINAQAPKMMYEECKKRNIRMVQVSTDCVFDGSKPHTEDESPNAIDLYGKTKAMGEHGDIIIRTSFIGIGQRGIINWLMGEKNVNGYQNVKWNGVTVNNAALAILGIAENVESGVYHVYGPDTTKYDLLCDIKKAFNLKVEITPVEKPIADMRLRHKINHVYIPDNIEGQLEQMRSDFIEYFCGDSRRTK